MKEETKGGSARRGGRKKRSGRRGDSPQGQGGRAQGGEAGGGGAERSGRAERGGRGERSGRGDRAGRGGSREERSARAGRNDRAAKGRRGEQGEKGKPKKSRKAVIAAVLNDGKFVRKRSESAARLKWVPPKPLALDLRPVDCPWCGKPIKEFSTAIADRESGRPVHFECAVARLSETERLAGGDALGYIGGGRFGVIGFDDEQNPKKKIRIKKILEWENTETRSQWRTALCEHFSIT